MELPTYTGIWRIEKRLYKLYDFRLPMPLPVGQIAVFVAITVPYVLLLTLFGLPFSHTLFWLYVLPPAVFTWLATRPVLESKRLPELVISQVRYLGEPSAWCRMTPHVEKDEMVVVGRAWRRSQAQPAIEPAVEPPAVEPAVEPALVPAVERAAVRGGAWPGGRAARRAIPAPASSEAAAPVRPSATAQPPGRAPAAVPGAGRPQRVRDSQRPVPASSRASARDVTRARASASVPAPASAPAPAPVPAPARAAGPARAPA
ncbi:MAG TPA: conjugal transfer protein, partial [Streptosporangiaceae bacterium]